MSSDVQQHESGGGMHVPHNDGGTTHPGAAWAGHVEAHDLAASFGHGGAVGRRPQEQAMAWFRRMRKTGMLDEAYRDGRTYQVPDAAVDRLRERMRLRATGLSVAEAVAKVNPPNTTRR